MLMILPKERKNSVTEDRNNKFESLNESLCDALHDLVPFLQFK